MLKSKSNIPLTWELRKHYRVLYICPSCGCLFYAKFRDLDTCITCSKDFHEEMDRKLKTNLILKNQYK